MSKSTRNGTVALLLGLTSGVVAAIFDFQTHGFSSGVETYVLPIFFALVGVELRDEFTHGYFKTKSRLLAPSLAAIFGVVGAAGPYVLLAGETGWAVPTATDITLGLAVLATFGSRLGLKARFLALATIDDLIGLVLILVLFTSNLSLVNIAIAVIALVLFFASQFLPTWISRALIFLAPLSIIFAAEAGVQTSVFGFLIGLALRDQLIRRSLPNINNYFVLPIFGFAVMAGALKLPIEQVAPLVLLGVTLRPLGKLFGIAIGGVFGDYLTKTKPKLLDWLGLGLLGGIGLTVSFLLAELSFSSPVAKISAILGTLLATLISTVAFSWYAFLRARRASR